MCMVCWLFRPRAGFPTLSKKQSCARMAYLCPVLWYVTFSRDGLLYHHNKSGILSPAYERFFSSRIDSLTPIFWKIGKTYLSLYGTRFFLPFLALSIYFRPFTSLRLFGSILPIFSVSPFPIVSIELSNHEFLHRVYVSDGGRDLPD